MISALLVSLWSSEILLATRNCKNFWTTLKLQKVCKKFKSRAALLCLKSTFSNLRTNLTIVSPYRFRITWNNDNVLGNLRRTKNIKTNAIVSALPVAPDFLMVWPGYVTYNVTAQILKIFHVSFLLLRHGPPLYSFNFCFICFLHLLWIGLSRVEIGF